MKTQAEMVIDYIKDFGSITTFEAFTELGITRLGSRIYELRKDGYKIGSETILKKNRYGKPIHFAKYKLLEEVK